MLPTPVHIRTANPRDNAGLLELAAACPMQGEVGLCVDRAPDFLSLCRLWGDPWKTLVAETKDERIAGSVGVGMRESHIDGSPTPVAFVGDLKVHPDHRGTKTGAADELIAAIRETCREFAGDDVPTVLTILSGNRQMEGRIPGPRGLPRFMRFATMLAWSLPLLWRMTLPWAGQYRIEAATESDVEEMVHFWRWWAPRYQCSTVFTADSFLRWIDSAPGLDLQDYWIARRGNGTLAGFLGLWDQACFKQLRVTGYSRRLRIERFLFNHLGPLRIGGPLPEAGDHLRCVSAIHLCTPPGASATLRALLIHATDRLRGRDVSLINLGLDRADPRKAALRGLFAAATPIHAYVTSPRGEYTGPQLGGLPLSLELSLV